MNLTIRKFNKKDIGLYLEGEIDAFKSTYPSLSITSKMKNEFKDHLLHSFYSEASIGYTAELEQPIGLVIISTQTVYTIPTAYIENIYINEENRNKGYARELLAFSEKTCRENGYNILQLDVSSHNKSALELYQSEGFTPAGYRMEKNIAL